MLRVGIVGKNYSESYISIVNEFDHFEFIGIFDPSFQFEHPKHISKEFVYVSFEDLLHNCDSILFASPEKIYLPLIELAVKYSKPVFLHSVHNLSYTEQLELLKLQEEAGEVLQIQQPLIFHDTFMEFRKISNNPLLLQYHYADSFESKLLLKTRAVIGALLTVFKSNIRKITANTISACSEIPDIINIRIDFDNGGIAEIMMNAIENKKINQLKCFEYNGFYEIDFTKNIFSGTKNKHPLSSRSHSENNFPQKLLEKQLIDFYHNIKEFKSPANGIENELLTQEVIEKIKEKLRININIF